MKIQLAIGAAAILVNISISAVAAFVLEELFRRAHPWLISPPQRPKLLLLVIGVGFWASSASASGSGR